MIDKREARSIIRKAVKRVPEGEEIRHINIMPMMDIMTILLVAMIFQASQAAAFSVGAVELPHSQSMEKVPEGAVTITIAKEAILIEGRPVVNVKNGDVDASEKKGGALGIEIPKVSRFLGLLRKDAEAEIRARGQEPPEPPELLVIADRSTPYKLLFEIIASARADDAGYRRFRLIVLEQDRG